MARIVIVTDHKWRDLPGNVYLKLMLEKRWGHETILVRLNEESAVVPSFQPDIVIYNNLYDAKKNAYARSLSQCGVRIVILPTEGITFSDQQTELFSHKYADIGFVDLYLAWNQLMADAMIHHHVLPSDRILITGNGRFDFYSQSMTQSLPSKAEFSAKYGLNSKKIKILLATNFANAEFWPDTRFLEKDLKRQKATDLSAFSDAKKLAHYEWKYRQAIFELVRQIAASFQEVEILIKYHPSERVAVYRELADQIQNSGHPIHLIEGEYIWDVIHASDIILHRCSTVAIEAWLLGKPTVELELFESLEHFLQPKYEKGSVIAKSLDDIRMIIESWKKDSMTINPELEKTRRDIMKYIIHEPDGNSTKRIAAAIHAIADEPTRENPKIAYGSTKNFIKSKIRLYFGMRGYDILAGIYRLKIGDYLGRYEKNFSAADVKFWTNRLSRLVENKNSKGSRSL